MQNWNKYWKNRQANWKEIHLDGWGHPHRQLIMNRLKKLKWFSLFEIGCGGGANLYRIIREFPDREVGGVDINQDAINLTWGLGKELHKVSNGKMKEFFVEARDFVNQGAFISDKGVDVILTDMTCIYFNFRQMKRVLREIKRITRFNVIFCEFHHKSWFRRFWLWIRSGYRAYNWERLLDSYGFYDIQIEKIDEKDWPGGNPQKDFGYIISCKV